MIPAGGTPGDSSTPLGGMGGADTESDLVFHFPFDGDLNDISGGRVGQQSSEDGGVISFARGTSGQSLDLSKSNAHVIVSNEPAFTPTDLTLVFWAQSELPAPTGAPQILMGMGRNCLNTYHCGIYPDATIKCELNDGRGWCEDGVTLDVEWPVGRFIHVAFAIEQDAQEPLVRLRLYLDGVLVKSEERADYFPVQEPERPFVVGANFQQPDSVGVAPYYSKAQIDDLRLYNRALSEIEVKQLFDEHRSQ